MKIGMPYKTQEELKQMQSNRKQATYKPTAKQQIIKDALWLGALTVMNSAVLGTAYIQLTK